MNNKERESIITARIFNEQKENSRKKLLRLSNVISDSANFLLSIFMMIIITGIFYLAVLRVFQFIDRFPVQVAFMNIFIIYVYGVIAWLLWENQTKNLYKHDNR